MYENGKGRRNLQKMFNKSKGRSGSRESEKSSEEPCKLKCFRCKHIGNTAKEYYSEDHPVINEGLVSIREDLQDLMTNEKRTGEAEQLIYLATSVDSSADTEALSVGVNKQINLWCLDSDCTSHMCSNKGKFQDLNVSNVSTCVVFGVRSAHQ